MVESVVGMKTGISGNLDRRYIQLSAFVAFYWLELNLIQGSVQVVIPLPSSFLTLRQALVM